MQARAVTLRNAMRADPVTSRVAAFVGIPAVQVDLLSGLAFAGILEGVACLLWFVAFKARDLSRTRAVAPRQTEPVTASNDRGTTGHAMVDNLVMSRSDDRESEVTRLASEIAAGRVRATVADIRRYLGCSQAKAMALRRQFSESTVTE